jgi:hypothetical protein
MGQTAARLGATPEQGQRLAAYQLDAGYELMPDRYRSGECRDGGTLDLRPRDTTWP